MPKKGISEAQEGCKLEVINQIQAFKNSFINEYIDKSFENKISKNANNFIYLTPISNKGKKCFFPSNPKKIKDPNKDDIVVKGKNLLYIFESM